MIPTPVLVTFVLVAAIIGAAYYLLVLKPEEDEQRALRKRLKTGGVDAEGGRARPACCRTETPLSQIPVVNAHSGRDRTSSAGRRSG